MRPARLLGLAGVLVAAGGLYLGYLRVDAAALAGVDGWAAPSIWAEFGALERILTVLVVAALVSLAFRPHRGRFDSWGAVGGLVVALGAVAGVLVLRAVATSDAALLAAALDQAGAAGPGIGFLIVAAGALVAAAGAGWDLLEARREAAEEEPAASPADQSPSTTLPPDSEATLASESTLQP